MSEFTVIKQDAQGEQLLIGRVDETGAELDSASIKLILADLAGTNVKARFREFQFKDAGDSCVLKKMWILCTEPEVV